MSRSNLHLMSLLSVTLVAACVSESDMREDVSEPETVLQTEDGFIEPRGGTVFDRAVKTLDPVAEGQGPTSAFTPLSYAGSLGSQIYSPAANSSTAGLSNSFQPSCGYSNSTPDAYFVWTAPSTGTYVFTTGTSYFDTILELRPTGNPSVSLGCNDDWGNTRDSAVTLSITAGTSIYVIVDGYGSASGAYRLNIARTYSAGWTPWRNRDNAGGEGDFETLPDLVNAGQSCANPISVECQTTSGVPASSTGEVYHCNTSFAGYCRNSEQPDGYCLDYRVRMLCP